jgi:hypothetical protein
MSNTQLGGLWRPWGCRLLLAAAVLAGTSTAWGDAAYGTRMRRTERAMTGVVVGTAWPCVGFAIAANLPPVGVRVSQGNVVAMRIRAYAPQFRFEVRLDRGEYLFSTAGFVRRHVRVAANRFTPEDLNPHCK